MAEWSSRCWQGDTAHITICLLQELWCSCIRNTWTYHTAKRAHDVQGANTPFIMKSRGLSRAVPMSEMLERNPQIKHLMEAGELVPDVSCLHIQNHLATCNCRGPMCMQHLLLLLVGLCHTVVNASSGILELQHCMAAVVMFCIISTVHTLQPYMYCRKPLSPVTQPPCQFW